MSHQTNCAKQPALKLARYHMIGSSNNLVNPNPLSAPFLAHLYVQLYVYLYSAITTLNFDPFENQSELFRAFVFPLAARSGAFESVFARKICMPLIYDSYDLNKINKFLSSPPIGQDVKKSSDFFMHSDWVTKYLTKTPHQEDEIRNQRADVPFSMCL